MRCGTSSQFILYIINGINGGFHISYQEGSPRKSSTHNLLSAAEHPEVIENYIHEELGLGRLLGPLLKRDIPLIHCSPFEVIPKKGDDVWRLIIDLSSPKNRSINDGIREDLASIPYATINKVVKKVLDPGQGTYMAKTDIKSAFLIIPVHPIDRWLLGFESKGNVYIDKVLPFGLRLTPKIFNAVANAAHFITRSQGIQWISHHLDDFLILGQPRSKQCQCDLDPIFPAHLPSVGNSPGSRKDLWAFNHLGIFRYGIRYRENDLPTAGKEEM